jgi:hypothetical protein
MKTLLACLAAVVASAAFAQSADVSRADAVAARDRELNALIVSHSVDAARDFYDDQFVLTTSSGKMKDKNAILADVASQELTLTANETTDVIVRVRDNTALLTGVLHQSGTYKGNGFDVRLRVTDTWVFVDGNWRILAGHASTM